MLNHPQIVTVQQENIGFIEVDRPNVVAYRVSMVKSYTKVESKYSLKESCVLVQDRAEQGDEEKLIAEQRQLAHREKARRAREELETAHQLQIQNARTAAGLCSMCGRKLGILERLLARLTHRHCKVFID